MDDEQFTPAALSDALDPERHRAVERVTAWASDEHHSRPAIWVYRCAACDEPWPCEWEGGS